MSAATIGNRPRRKGEDRITTPITGQQARDAARSKIDKARTVFESAVPAAMTPEEAGKLGGRGKKAPDNVRGFGNTREYRIAQLKKAGRDDLAQAVIDRQISAHAAAIEAGLIKVKSPLDQALAAFQRLSPEDRVTFMELAGV